VPATAPLTTPAAPTATPPGSPGASDSADSRRLVAEVGFKQSDLRGGGTVELRPHGDQVAGFVTLDNCGFEFTTEAARTARRQVDITLADARAASYSNEVVAYLDEATAALAVDQMRQSVRSCDGGVFQTAATGGRYRYETLAFVEHAGGFPVDDAMSLTQRITAEDGAELYSLAVFLHSGTLLDAHYFKSQQKPTRKEIATLTAQAMVTANRLAARPA